ncbi:MAG: biotin/lipoyl-binding protein [Oscillospiraceae bacterium]|nr:biotin/lipoyl-binding protein [Oscillospiraceae bacterium]
MKKYSVTVNGTVYDVMVEEADVGRDAPGAPSAPIPAAKPAPSAGGLPSAPTSAQGNIKIESPMPGTIVDVKVGAGEAVQKGAVIAVLEAMKMENDIVAAADGVVISINVKKGDSVNTGTVIATMNAG